MADMSGEVRCPDCGNWAYQTGFTGAIICHHCEAAKIKPTKQPEPEITMDHESIKNHLRLAEIAGIKLRLEVEDSGSTAFSPAGAGLYTASERWEPFNRIEQAYNVLSRFCDRYDEGNMLVTWTLDRETTPDGFPKYIFHLEVTARVSETIYEDGTSPAIIICRGILEIDRVINLPKNPLLPVDARPKPMNLLTGRVKITQENFDMLPPWVEPDVLVGQSPPPFIPSMRWKEKIGNVWYLVVPDPERSAFVYRHLVTIVPPSPPVPVTVEMIQEDFDQLPLYVLHGQLTPEPPVSLNSRWKDMIDSVWFLVTVDRDDESLVNRQRIAVVSEVKP